MVPFHYLHDVGDMVDVGKSADTPKEAHQLVSFLLFSGKKKEPGK